MKKILFILFLCVQLIGCSQTISIEQLTGKYIANHPYGDDYLILKADGTYLYSFTDKNGNTTTNENRWSVEQEKGDTVITFFKFDFAIPDYGTDLPGYWVVKVTKTLTGAIRLIIDPDLDYYYSKIK